MQYFPKLEDGKDDPSHVSYKSETQTRRSDAISIQYQGHENLFKNATKL